MGGEFIDVGPKSNRAAAFDWKSAGGDRLTRRGVRQNAECRNDGGVIAEAGGFADGFAGLVHRFSRGRRNGGGRRGAAWSTVRAAAATGLQQPLKTCTVHCT